MSYKLSSYADELCIRLGYLLILGREPENEVVVSNALQARKTIAQLRSDILRSREMEAIVKRWMIDAYLKCKYDNGMAADAPKAEQSDRVIVVQTSDETRYSYMLECSSKYNKIYADHHKLDYQKYVGIKRGAHPHHATFNRVHILEDLIDHDYGGWILYVDADAIVSNPYFAIKEYLHKLRSSGKMMLLHSVQPPGAPDYNWWNVNAGCFAIDLGRGRARSLVEAWAGIYNDLYSIKEYRAALKWGSIFDDQSALWLILQIFEMRDHVELADLQGKNGFVRQVLRSGSSIISSKEEITARCDALLEIGQSAYDADAFRKYFQAGQSQSG